MVCLGSTEGSSAQRVRFGEESLSRATVKIIDLTFLQRWPTLVGAATPLDVATFSTPDIDGGDAVEHAITYTT